MNEQPLTYDQLDTEAALLRPLLRRPPWQRHDTDASGAAREDTGTKALFRRYKPGAAPHTLSAELRGAVWQHLRFVPGALKQDEAALNRAVDHAALVLHLLARGPAASPSGLDLGTACKKAGVADARFIRITRTPSPRRLEALSRLMHRLDKAGAPLHWAALDAERQSRPWNARMTSTDEVWPLLNFLYGYEPDPSIARWAAGFFSLEADKGEALEAERATTDDTAV